MLRRVLFAHSPSPTSPVPPLHISNGRRLFFTRPPAPVSTFDLTHTVDNQVPPLVDYNAFASYPLVAETLIAGAANAHGGDGGKNKSILVTPAQLDLCQRYGTLTGTATMLTAATTAIKNPPTFAAFSRYGQRSPGVAEFHPAYHTIMGAAIEHRVPSLAWVEENAHLPRSVLNALHYQLEMGTACPLTMTFAGVAPLKRGITVASKAGDSATVAELQGWVDKLTSGNYDPANAHISEKSGATIGMSMTEKQGGSDVRTNATTATPINSGNGGQQHYTLRGHKWFTSAPMCDAFLTLANVVDTSSGKKSLACFLVPRWVAPGEPNIGLQFQRLKEKMGDKANASSEVEYHDAIGILVGGRGEGVKTLIEMVNLTRLDCLVSSAALMHRAGLEASHHAATRSAFGGVLGAKPLMRNVLSDLSIEAEAATALALRLSSAFNASSGEATFARIAVAIAKYLVCKRAPAVAYEAMECLGGNGYTEDFIMSRLFRQSPLNAIWEGSGNVVALDVFRAMQSPAVVEALRAEIAPLATSDPARLAGPVADVDAALVAAAAATTGGGAAALEAAEIQGRVLVERLARLLQARALQRLSSPRILYDAFVETRISPGGTCCLFGTLPTKYVDPAIQQRITPVFTK